MLADRSNRLRTTIAHPQAVRVVNAKPNSDAGIGLGELKLKL